MLTTVLIVLLLAAGVAILVHPPTLGTTASGRPVPLRWAGGVLLALALLGVVVSCTTIIQAKNVGVITTFGKPSSRTLAAGIHLKTPWQKVTSLDGTIKTDEYAAGGCIPVRIGDGSQSCVTMAHRWQIVPSRAGVIYANFRTNDPTESLRDAVVSTQLKSVVQDVLARYNPVAGLRVVNGKSAATESLDFAPDYDQISKDIATKMEERYGSDPLVKTVAITVSGVSLSESTQTKINDFIAEVANTRIKAQAAVTATEQAAANRALAASVSKDPNVLVSKCLDTLGDMVQARQPVPAGFSCWPGGGSSVVVPSAR